MQEKYNRDFKGIWIPKNIWLNKNLSLQEKVFLAEIDSLNCNGKGCYASNQYFSDFFGLSKHRVSNIISELVDKGFLSTQIVYKGATKEVEKRLLFVICKNEPIDENVNTLYTDSDIGGIDEKVKENNKDILYNKDNKKEETNIGIGFSKPNDISFEDDLLSFLELVYNRELTWFTIEEVYQVFSYFIENRKTKINTKHPNITKSQLQVILENLNFCYVEDYSFDLSPSDYPKIIDQYFKTKFDKNCNYSIQHFFSGEIRALKYMEMEKKQ